MRFVVLFALGLAVRFAYLLEIRHTPLTEVLLIDSETYDRLARLILAGRFHGEEVYSMNVLYPYFLAGVYALAGGSPWAVLAVQALLDTAGVALVAGAGEAVFSRPAGIIAGLAAAVYGPFVFYTGALLTPTLILFLMLAALACLLAWRKHGRISWAMAAGGAVGLATLARGNNILLVPLAVLFFREATGRWSRVWKPWLAFALMAASLVGLATLRNFLVEGKVVPVAANYAAFYVGHNPEATGLYAMPSFTGSAGFEEEVWGTKDAVSRKLGRPVTLAESSRYLFEQGLDYLWRHPLDEAKLAARKFHYFWNRTESPTNLNYHFARRHSNVLRGLGLDFGIVAPLGLLGLVLAAIERRRSLVLVLFLLVPLLTGLLFFVSAEYRLPAATVLMIYAGFAVVRLAESIRPARSPEPRKLERRPDSASPGRIIALGIVLLPALFLFCHHRDPLLKSQSLLRVDYLNFGTLYRQRGDLERAEVMFRKSLSIDPRYGPAYAGLAEVERLRGDDVAAARLIEEAGRYRLSGQYDRGANRIPPHPTETALRLYRERQYQEALAEFEKILSSAPAGGDLRLSIENNIGLCHLKLGRPDEAERIFRRLIGAHPGYVKAYNNLALVHESRGDSTSAADLYRKVLEMEPDNALARRKLERPWRE